MDIFPLNLGGNTFGWTSDRDASFAVLDAFVAAGGNFIDTADLQRLQTDYIDLYYAHYDDENVAIIDQVKHAHSLVESGKVKHIALSNFDSARMREWFETAKAEGLTLPVAIQPQYNLIHRADFENGYKPIVDEFDVAVFPYFTLAPGVLTGKYRSKEDLQGKARHAMAEDLITDDALQVVDAVVEIAKPRRVESATVLLTWLLADGKSVTAPVASASNPEQLPALITAADLKLSANEVQQLDDAPKALASPLASS